MKKLLLFCFAILGFILPSCTVMKTMPDRDAGQAAKGGSKGDVVSVTLKSGITVDKIRVREVWAESILLGSDSKPIRFASIQKLSKRKISYGLSFVAGVLTLSIAAVLFKNTYHSSWRPFANWHPSIPSISP